DRNGVINTGDARDMLVAILNGDNVIEEPNASAFRLSSIADVTDENGERTYTVYAPYTDTFMLTSSDVESMTIEKDGELIATDDNWISKGLIENEEYTLTVKTASPNASFKITVKAINHIVTLPYDVATPLDTTTLSVDGTASNPLKPATIEYVKREGGTYIYSNNPEQFSAAHVGKAFMRNDGLTGDVYVTLEHANYSGQNAYLGYQLKNNSDHDVYVTVLNVGYQWTGTWFGQLAWYDFYNTAFELPDDYFTASGAISSKYAGLDYAYKDYEPRVYHPTTYRLPAGEYFWVIGGTSADAYNNINVDNSANHAVNPVRCANGNVKFTVTGGEVTGTMYCYTNAAQVKAEPAALGYVADGYAQQYSGIADHHGVIDNYMTWTFNDSVGAGMLPVSYTNYYDNNCPAQTAPYAAYNSTAHTTTSTTSWMTHLNPQNDHRAVGMDMVDFRWHDQNGNEIIIDNDHADGAGLPANTANWMIEYQDHFTLVNQGDKERTVTLHLRDHGSLALLVRDSQTGSVLETAFTAGLGESYSVFSNYTYDVV
ncbi:MAG: hypothetical protein IKV35_05295, partial [Clostridia bacterium]|nr:hypothetical protein [Clostridia bacterium]